MNALHQEAAALAASIASAEIAYDATVKACRLLRGSGRISPANRRRLWEAEAAAEAEADALRALRTRLERLHRQAERGDARAVKAAEAARQGVLL